VKSNRKITFLFLLTTIALLSGCMSTTPMALKPDDQALTKTNQALVLMSLRTSNLYHERYQPDAKYVVVKNSQTQQKKRFALKGPFNQGEKYRYYLVSMALDPTQYQIEDVNGMSRSFLPPIVASFDAEQDADFNVENSSPIYIGNLDLTLVERSNNKQPRGGSIAPLIDQAVSGFSGGTFKIAINDNYNQDLQNFEQAYPSLKGVKISKKLMKRYG
jgi:hypothetical protein